MSKTCHRCGAIDPTGSRFYSTAIPFRGSRVFCPKCYAKLEDNLFIAILLLNIWFFLIGFAILLSNSSSRVGHQLVNVALVQIVVLPSIVIHEYAHGIVAKAVGLSVLRIWIGRGKTFYRATLLGFDTEFKLIPFGGLTLMTHGLKKKLRFRYTLAILAGPMTNVIIFVVAWRFDCPRNFDISTRIQFGLIIMLVQLFILVENLLPFRIQTPMGKLCTDGLSLIQLFLAKSPDMLRFGSQQNNIHASKPLPRKPSG